METNPYAYLNIARNTALPPFSGRRINRKQIRYLPMDQKPADFHRPSLNRSLGNLSSIYIDPSTLSGSTLSLPSFVSQEQEQKRPNSLQLSDNPTVRLDRLCRGFIDVEIQSTHAPVISNEQSSDNPPDGEAWELIALYLLDKGSEMTAKALSKETARILLLRWAPASSGMNAQPAHGFALMLWPAANGFRRDLYYRY